MGQVYSYKKSGASFQEEYEKDQAEKPFLASPLIYTHIWNESALTVFECL